MNQLCSTDDVVCSPYPQLPLPSPVDSLYKFTADIQSSNESLTKPSNNSYNAGNIINNTNITNHTDTRLPTFTNDIISDIQPIAVQPNHSIHHNTTLPMHSQNNTHTLQGCNCPHSAACNVDPSTLNRLEFGAFTDLLHTKDTIDPVYSRAALLASANGTATQQQIEHILSILNMYLSNKQAAVHNKLLQQYGSYDVENTMYQSNNLQYEYKQQLSDTTYNHHNSRIGQQNPISPSLQCSFESSGTSYDVAGISITGGQQQPSCPIQLITNDMFCDTKPPKKHYKSTNDCNLKPIRPLPAFMYYLNDNYNTVVHQLLLSMHTDNNSKVRKRVINQYAKQQFDQLSMEQREPYLNARANDMNEYTKLKEYNKQCAINDNQQLITQSGDIQQPTHSINTTPHTANLLECSYSAPTPQQIPGNAQKYITLIQSHEPIHTNRSPSAQSLSRSSTIPLNDTESLLSHELNATGIDLHNSMLLHLVDKYNIQSARQLFLQNTRINQLCQQCNITPNELWDTDQNSQWKQPFIAAATMYHYAKIRCNDNTT